MREPLYVMATRGRESNRLYVNTSADLDPATGHEQPDHVEAADVLRNAIATSGADISATQTHHNETAVAERLCRLLRNGVQPGEGRAMDEHDARLEAEPLPVTDEHSAGVAKFERTRSLRTTSGWASPDRDSGISR